VATAANDCGSQSDSPLSFSTAATKSDFSTNELASILSVRDRADQGNRRCQCTSQADANGKRDSDSGRVDVAAGDLSCKPAHVREQGTHSALSVSGAVQTAKQTENVKTKIRIQTESAPTTAADLTGVATDAEE
jgi:hypothetical protein